MVLQSLLGEISKQKMKEYNRKTKRWEEPTTGLGKFKSRDLCKGQREHDYILCLPSYIRVTDEIKPEAITEYYASEDRRRIFDKKESALLASLGIKDHHWRGSNTKHYRCLICDKRKYG